MGMNVWVVGASNVDVIAKCRDKVIAADSNIGTVEKAAGGVGRNIASALRAMGFDVSFLTAIVIIQEAYDISWSRTDRQRLSSPLMQ